MTENDPHAPDSAAGRQNPSAQPGTEGQAAWSQTSGTQPASGEPSSAPYQAPAEPAHHAPTSGDAGYGAPSPWSPQGAQAQAGAQPGQASTGPNSAQSGHPGLGQAGTGQTPAQPGSAQFGTGPTQAQYNPYPATGGQPANPYAAPGAQPLNPSVYAAAPAPPKKTGAGRLMVGVAAIALVIGGVAGGTVGYLTGGSSGPSVNALDQPKPAEQTGNAPAGSVEAVAQKLSPSVVELQVSGRQAAGEGSGFVLSSDGYILTNNHVVEVAANGGQIQAVFPDGKKATAQVVGRDPTTDIAVVKVSGVNGLTPVELGRSDDLKVGQPVVAIGSPFELTGTVTSGIVSSLHRPVQAGGDETDQTTVMDAVQTDAAINPGNSGGPLSNMSGQVIGINSAIYSPQTGQGSQSGSQGGNVGIGFAIPIDQARRTADDIIKTGHANQTYIGAKVQDAQNGGAQLGDVTPGSPAEKAGLKSGDVITKIGDRTIDSANTLIAAIRTRAPDEKVTFTLADGRTVPVTLGGQPVSPN
ncbi:trypsin-like peptidase domain-containing protein [Amycolatopsis sp. PS_44_ISF1]|uniref:S1C family serine protease n=1 Tax=Amycolatopsis sp. PS_44_ISF1 TaxID=2974917 RepID=UPI0028DEF59C|nr:trypsin-like peptidase domain-containing protein [Amycolatopsis sp. PS_44_ISF1]MDT8911291.1 trypsin-like peptidase domain-containing protein [Amycolatopsis sp. PS_44_ISF1]